MLIPIDISIPSASNQKLPPAFAKVSHDEIVLIELQGALDVESNHESERNGKLVGKLSIDEAMKKSTLRIGHHHLEGKIVTLPKAIAVIQKSSSAQNSEDDAMVCDEDNNGGTISWRAIAIVKRKIIFSKRPMPIVGRPS
ncbi:Ctf8-domain-containing protein [Desarmillaria tabescens]|uniref:Ctf8-domain-containing protein n=1 Tax=Armillaria tabescens TaxID=1929756 RepID=A0AA39NQ55_ARMTA|nr:Ctf8-domain-containing protein [Desarmillaria tabescens]KAK0469493.1 Ctf8-domain-containing protein [Desarmillaria tabescens]